MKTRSCLISFPLSYHCNHSLHAGIFFYHLKISMIKSLYKKGGRTSVANSVNQSVNHLIIVCAKSMAYGISVWLYFSIYLNINQLDTLNFIMSLFHASTCFEHMCSSSGGQNCTVQSLVSSHL